MYKGQGNLLCTLIHLDDQMYIAGGRDKEMIVINNDKFDEKLGFGNEVKSGMAIKDIIIFSENDNEV